MARGVQAVSLPSKVWAVPEGEAVEALGSPDHHGGSTTRAWLLTTSSIGSGSRIHSLHCSQRAPALTPELAMGTQLAFPRSTKSVCLHPKTATN